MQDTGDIKHSARLSRLRSKLASSAPSHSRAVNYQKEVLARAYDCTWDRVNVLGDESYGHTGCINALSWSQDGKVLISGGDDTTVRLWRMDCEDTTTTYPFKCDAVIRTGHRANIFNAQMLPSSSKIVTVAGDNQVRILDAEHPLSIPSGGREAIYTSQQSCIRVLKCHTGRTKRIITESSPDQFLTVAEDGAVRQHDLRVPHQCSSNTCPQPLVKLPHDLSSLALSQLAPYYFVVGGESEYGYLFDRRQIGRLLHSEWGVPVDDTSYTTCVRRFGRSNRGPGELQGTEHITGVRMSQTNGHEVLLSYSGDAVYLYSTRDDPKEHSARRYATTVIPPNAKKRKPSTPEAEQDEAFTESSASDLDDFNMFDLPPLEDPSSEDEDDSADESTEGPFQSVELPERFKAPIILPRSRYAGASNVETVKDVSFVGPNDEYLASGSDDGNFFIWKKRTGEIHGIYEGDSNVVNVIEHHPYYPILAVSGIDTTVKLFSLTGSHSASEYSRTTNAEDIIATNLRQSRRSLRQGLSSLYLQYRYALREAGINADDVQEQSQCTFQ